MSSLLVLGLFLAAYPSALVGLAGHVIISVDSSSGHDNATCLQTQKQPCQTLEYVQSQLKSVANESVIIEICGPQINLTKALNFTHFNNLSIRGAENSNTTKVVCNRSYSGLSFINVTGLILEYIQLTNCGAESNSTIYDPSTNRMIIELSAIYLLNCRDVNITNTGIYRSNGTGVSMLNADGYVYIEHTDIEDSSLRSNSVDLIFGGSGLHIEFGYCSNGNDPYGHNNCTHSEHYSNATYTIHGCSFKRNFANVSKSLASFYDIGPMGCGGGAYVGFAVITSNITVTLNNCTFYNNSAAKYGGGMKLQFYKTSHDNSVFFFETTFTNNSVPTEKMGGGLEVAFFQFRNYSCVENNFITFKSCKFTSNSAGRGGGVNILFSEVSFEDEKSAIIFTNCTWTRNAALYGAAVHIVPATWAYQYKGHSRKMTFINCTISSNFIVPVTRPSHSSLQVQVNGAGAFFCLHVTVTFCGVSRFESNNGTALYLSGSIAIFNTLSVIVFDGNDGTNGGAVSLIGRAFFLLNGPSNFSFINNKARQLGGGIYFQSTDNDSHQPCFIHRDKYTKKSSFIFSANNASSGQGHHIFASSFTSCGLYCLGAVTSVYGCIGIFNFSNPSNDTTATLPAEFYLHQNGTIAIIPGILTILPLTVKDLVGNNVSNLSYESSLEDKNPNSSLEIDAAFRYVSNNAIVVCGKQNENASLRLDTLSTDISLLVNITLVQCPPGYVLNKTDDKCKCNAASYYGIQRCDPEAHIMYGVWMGRCDKSSSGLCTTDCPIGYCEYKYSSSSTKGLYRPMPYKALDLQQLEHFICSPTRTGTICGQCKSHHSVYFNSWDFECGKDKYCHLGPLFYILTTIVPLTLIFIVIILLDTNIVGEWNGFILFSQVVNFLYIHANGTIPLSSNQFRTLNGLTFAYSFFNLEILNLKALSFCIWKGAGVMDILIIKLSSILFALVLVLLTVLVLKHHILTNCFPCLSRRRFSVVNGISAFFILCYALCAKTCLQVLDSICLYDENYECSKSVVFFDGNMSVFEGPHIKYATVAVIFLIFIVIVPPALLLFYPLFFKMLGICRLSESKFAMFLWKMIPIQLLDSFQNIFNDNCRYFAGLYFLYRAIAMAAYAQADGLVEYYAVVEVEFVSIIVLHAVFQPYRKRLFNIIDVLLFFNITLINGITLYNYLLYSLSKTGDIVHSASWLISVQIALLFLPLVSAGIYLIYRLSMAVRRRFIGSSNIHGYSEINHLSYSR